MLSPQSERDGFSYKTETSVLFDQTSDSSNRVVQINMDVDAEVSASSSAIDLTSLQSVANPTKGALRVTKTEQRERERGFKFFS